MKNKLQQLFAPYDIDPQIIDQIMELIAQDYILTTEVDQTISLEKEKMLIQSTVLNELTTHKARNITACTALLDHSTITVNNGVVTGISEQVLKMKKEYPYLFEGNDYTPKNNATLQDEENLTDQEYFNILKNKGGKY